MLWVDFASDPWNLRCFTPVCSSSWYNSITSEVQQPKQSFHLLMDQKRLSELDDKQQRCSQMLNHVCKEFSWRRQKSFMTQLQNIWLLVLMQETVFCRPSASQIVCSDAFYLQKQNERGCVAFTDTEDTKTTWSFLKSFRFWSPVNQNLDSFHSQLCLFSTWSLTEKSQQLLQKLIVRRVKTVFGDLKRFLLETHADQLSIWISLQLDWHVSAVNIAAERVFVSSEPEAVSLTVTPKLQSLINL